VLRDVRRLLELAGHREILDPALDTLLKINVSWHSFVPACSTTPWQLEGVVRALLDTGYARERIHAVHNRTVVVDPRLGERENKLLPVVRAHGLRNVHLDEEEDWVRIEDAAGDAVRSFLGLHEAFPDGFSIPRRLIGTNIVHLPTVKTHVFTTTTGAMKNAFGGLLNEQRHRAHTVIHEALVDLLRIQQAIHPGILAVMDGTFAGDGPGPRCLVPHVKNVLLASSDQVAIDALAARMMGFDPLEDLRYVRLAHEQGLGRGDLRDVEIVGDVDAAEERWGFDGPFRRMTFASRMQHRIYWGRLRGLLEWSLRTWLAPWAYIASVVYHDGYWYPAHGRGVVRDALRSPWGRLFANLERLRPDADGWPDVGPAPGGLVPAVGDLVARAIRILGMAVAEAPELGRRRRRHPASTRTTPR
jgi:uncharacterized protein (DUF362 family)